MACPRNGGGRLREKARFTSLFTFCAAQEATARQTAVAKPQGTFYANAAQSLRGNQMEQRMLTATQEIVKHTKKTAELLKDGVGGGTMTFQ